MIELSGPQRYKLTYNENSFTSECRKGSAMFSGIATSIHPKLYVVCINLMPVYVGITVQSIRNRLRMGWQANGKNGYHGYAWRKKGTSASLDVWAHTNAENRKSLDIETIEAEVVYLIRQAGQWPKFQTEIHFHTSSTEHRNLAKKIFSHYQG